MFKKLVIHFHTAVFICLVMHGGHLAAQSIMTFDQLQQMRDESFSYLRMSDILCSRNQIDALKAAARLEGIQQPDDFIHALQETWCQDEKWKLTLSPWFDRLALPFFYQHVDTRKVIRHRKDFSDMFRPSSPDQINFFVKSGGRQVHLSVSREGGYDEFKLRLKKGRWHFVSYFNAGAC